MSAGRSSMFALRFVRVYRYFRGASSFYGENPRSRRDAVTAGNFEGERNRQSQRDARAYRNVGPDQARRELSGGTRDPLRPLRSPLDLSPDRREP